MARVVWWWFLLSTGLSISGAIAAEARVWKDASGSFQLEATLVKVENDKAYLRKADGREIAVPVDRLSAADREFLASRGDRNPFEESEAVAGASHGVVIISAKLGGQETLSAGLIYREAEGKTYVVVDGPGDFHPGVRNPTADTPPTFTAIWDAGDKRNKVELELVAHMRRKAKYLLRGPAKELPNPLDLKSAAKVTDGQGVRLIGFEIDPSTRSFTDFTLAANVAKIFRDADGSVARFQLDSKASLPVRMAVVLNEKGQPLGIFGLNLIQPTGGAVSGGISIAPIPKTLPWEEAEFGRVLLFPQSGDRKKIVWQVAVEYGDALGKTGKPVAIWKRLSQNTGDYRRFGDGVTATGPFDDKAPKIELNPGKLNEQSAAYFGALGVPATGTYLIGQFEEPNPGPTEHQFILQVGYASADAKDDKVVWTALQTATFGRNFPARRDGSPILPPDIPGFDGRPLDMPRAVKVEGGYQVTSEVTMPEPAIVGITPKSAPTPEKSTASLAGEVKRDDKLSCQRLTVETFNDKNRDRGRALAVYSADGKSLYVIDADNVLRRIDALTLKESATLKLGRDALDLQVCKAGVLVSLRGSSLLWQMHPDTLAVVREYDVPEIGCIGASGASNIGFTIASVKDPVYMSNRPELWMIDFSQGKVLHVLKTQFKNLGFTTPVGRPLSDHNHVMNMRMTSDGKYLFIGDRTIRRLRIEKEDLVMEEESTQDLHIGHTTHFMISADGKLAAMPTGGGQGPGYAIRILNGMNMKQEVLQIKNGSHPHGIGFDHQTGNVFSGSTEAMQVFTRTGEKTVTVPMTDRDVRRIYVDPRGDRFLACGEKYFTIYDLQGDRLKGD